MRKSCENRAKIETDWSDDIFFSSVYKNADRLVSEIVEEMDQQRRSADKYDCVSNWFQRVPNNIIAFCAHRGQGKTTAMKSFAHYLMTKDGETRFVVLDSIDPTALDGGESIVRVVLSRLFYRLEEMSDKEAYRDSPNKIKILELFEKCYTAVDYINGSVYKMKNDDDLEELAALGSSSRLKKNLQYLIALLLDVFLGDRGSNYTDKLLVIPIDDVDICTTDIYRCCEEIRNYLALPNVIILMAADYMQLTHVMYQKYLQKNIIWWKCEPDNAKEECSKLAFGYLLKLLPVNHVIELPVWDDIPNENGSSLFLEYYKKCDGSWKNFFGDSSGVGYGIRRQLGELIYDRTGIIIYDGDMLYPNYMPKTMRELMQLLKKFTELPAINEKILYGEAWDQAEQEAVRLRDNVCAYKSFFMESWCMNRMAHEEYTGFLKSVDELEKCKKNETIRWTYTELLEYICCDQKHPFNGSIVVNDAFCMFITIFLNEWFAEALYDSIRQRGKSVQYDKIADFIGIQGKLSENRSIEVGENTYQVYDFLVDNAIYSSDQFRKWEQQFDKAPFFFYTHEEQVAFSILHPWDNVIRQGVSYYSAVNNDKSDSNDSRVVVEGRVAAWIAILNTIANVPLAVQKWKKYLREGCYTRREEDLVNWRDIVLGDYKKKESGMETPNYHKKIHLGLKEAGKTWENELTSLDVLFLCNNHNVDLYYRDCKKDYPWVFCACGEENLESEDFLDAVAKKHEQMIDFEDIYKNMVSIVGEDTWHAHATLKKVVYGSKILNEVMQVIRNRQTESGSKEDLLKVIREIKMKYTDSGVFDQDLADQEQESSNQESQEQESPNQESQDQQSRRRRYILCRSYRNCKKCRKYIHRRGR